jgi:hypothetical protein
MNTFIWPTNTKRVTSPFGYRTHPLTGARGSHHNGIDIADGGTRPIYAVADGVVRRSYLSTSYGETIMIEHKINGVVWETVYAHMKENSRRFKVGDKVKQGDVIGTMGNTGNSTGQHLHFELHKGGLWNMAKSNAVDPEEYLEKVLYPNHKKSINQMAQEILDGKHGNGHDNRQKSLGISKSEYEKVRSEVNRLAGGKSIKEMAQEVVDGKHGNGHENRRKSLGISKAEYEKVRARVNEISNSKTIAQMAQEVIDGKHGNGHETRRKSLGISASEYAKVRTEVNKRV